MRYFLFLMMLFTFNLGNAQPHIEKSTLKGIKVVKDEFSGVTFYTHKQTGLSVAYENGLPKLNWLFRTMDKDPIIIESISINVDGEIFYIDISNNNTREYNELYGAYNWFYSEVTIRAEDYINLLDKIINSKHTPKIRYTIFSFSKQINIDGELNKKYIGGTSKIMNLYNELSSTQECDE